MYDGLGMATFEEEEDDNNLENDEHAIVKHFEEFYSDIEPEFRKFGEIIELKVCRNRSPHLKGNVYVEYATEEEAKQARSAFHGRYYAGKQLMVEFVPVTSWKAAICGLYARRSCSRGSYCNFLHPFANPRPLSPHDRTKEPLSHRSDNRDRDRHRSSNDDRQRSRSTDRYRHRHSCDDKKHSCDSDRNRRRKDQGSHARKRTREINEHRDRNRERDKIKGKKAREEI
jgi:RNA recognition motif-containing protein